MLARLGAAKRPLIVAGPMLMTRAGRAATQRLQEALRIPVVGMESPRGLADASLGGFSQMLAQADCVLLLGKRLDYTLKFGTPPAFAAACAVLQIDPEEAVARPRTPAPSGRGSPRARAPIRSRRPRCWRGARAGKPAAQEA